MSGGAFGYAQFHIEEIKDSIQQVLDNQGLEKPKDELCEQSDYYEKYTEEKFNYTYQPKVQEKLREAIKALETANIYAQCVDWLLSGDDGEETFLERLENELKEI